MIFFQVNIASIHYLDCALLLFDNYDYPRIDDINVADYKLIVEFKVNDEPKNYNQHIIEKPLRGISPTVDLGVVGGFISESTYSRGTTTSVSLVENRKIIGISTNNHHLLRSITDQFLESKTVVSFQILSL